MNQTNNQVDEEHGIGTKVSCNPSKSTSNNAQLSSSSSSAASRESSNHDEPIMTTPTTTTTSTAAAAATVTLPSPSSSMSPSSTSSHSKHSSFMGAVFNFTNCIVGAGAIGLGGAIAQSGGAISILAILFFAVLTKCSLDMVIEMSIQQQQSGNNNNNNNNNHASYEELGFYAYGTLGRNAVLLSKFLYSFGCLVAYLIVVKDNFSSALIHLIYGTNENHQNDDPIYSILANESLMTFCLSVSVLLPLCLLRDMSPLAHLSMLSVLSMTVIVVIVLVLFWAKPNIRLSGNGAYANWFEVRPGILPSLGTFVFTFVSQHTVHLTFQSMRPDLRTLQTWKRVSFCSLGIATHISLAVGLAVYMTFWQASRSDFFKLYPANLQVIHVAKLLLCVSMLWTFPLPFFTCREVLIVVALLPPPDNGNEEEEREVEENSHEVDPSSPTHQSSFDDPNTALREQLLPENGHHNSVALSTSSNPQVASASTTNQTNVAQTVPVRSRLLLLPHEDRQLVLLYHILLTCSLWSLTTILAIVAPSLGDVLNLVGCATGTLMAFVLPALFEFRLQGMYHPLPMLILIVGGVVGIIGTWFSLRKIISGK